MAKIADDLFMQMFDVDSDLFAALLAIARESWPPEAMEALERYRGGGSISSEEIEYIGTRYLPAGFIGLSNSFADASGVEDVQEALTDNAVKEFILPFLRNLFDRMEAMWPDKYQNLADRALINVG